MSKLEISDTSDSVSALPRGLRVAAALSWRLLVIVGAIYVLSLVVGRLSVVVIPVAIALLLAALLVPAVSALTRIHIPRSLSTVVVLIGGLAVVGGVLTFVINAFIDGFPQLQNQVLLSLGEIRGWLATSPLQIRDEQINTYVIQATHWLEENRAALTSGAISTASTFGNFLTGLVLMLFTLIFFLYDGRNIWLYLLRFTPKPVRGKVDLAGIRGFQSLVGYVRATALVAVADALGIGLGLTLIGVPLAVPLSALVFLGGFIPIVGAVLSGSVAVLVALVTNGPLAALMVLLVVFAVQQLEGHVLQPLLLGRAVSVHALAVVLAISCGVVVAGIVGALLAVPVVAVLNASIKSLSEEPAPAEPFPADLRQVKLPKPGWWKADPTLKAMAEKARLRSAAHFGKSNDSDGSTTASSGAESSTADSPDSTGTQADSGSSGSPARKSTSESSGAEEPPGSASSGDPTDRS